MTLTATIFRPTGLLVFLGMLLLANSAFGQASLSMSLAVNPTYDIDVNGNQTYTATVTNSGIGNASSPVVTFTLPSDDIPISGSPDTCSFVPGSSALTATCSLATIPPGTSADAVVVVHPTAVGQKDVSAVATESGGSSANASVGSQIIEVGISDLQITLSDNPDPAKVGASLVYSMTATNLGDDGGGNVFATLTLPSGVQYVSAPRACVHAGALVTCRANSLNPGASATFNILVKPSVSGWLYASAGVRMSTPDPSFANNSAATRTWVNP